MRSVERDVPWEYDVSDAEFVPHDYIELNGFKRICQKCGYTEYSDAYYVSQQPSCDRYLITRLLNE